MNIIIIIIMIPIIIIIIIIFLLLLLLLLIIIIIIIIIIISFGHRDTLEHLESKEHPVQSVWWARLANVALMEVPEHR